MLSRFRKIAAAIVDLSPAFRRRGAEIEPVILDRRRILIPPTRHGILFAIILFAMLLGAINYANSLGFVLTFLLGSLATVSIFHTYRNLAQLSIRAGKVTSVFAGQTAQFSVCVENPSGRSRYAIAVQGQQQAPQFGDIPSGHTVCLPLPIPATQRGLLTAGRFKLLTEFPLGLFRAWVGLELNMSCVIYPRPQGGEVPLPAVRADQREGVEQGAGSEDFSGLRTYHPGDSLRHVAWKAAAREHGLLTKQFTGQAQTSLWLEWDLLARMDTEARLSLLCRWVLDAEAAGCLYGLRLPGFALPPQRGEAHQRQCLEALALFASAPSRKTGERA